ncbi:MAG: DEAD/DEAH box helicase family protein [Caldilineaceae bacterium]|nr:DEAD/DEAH box helicase family protein [Caldilineaceae bacterium]MBP9074734.1 DEAD/DEAH box helicase family protein [Caldilineaceae bacterium]
MIRSRYRAVLPAAAFWIFSTFFNANIDELLKEEFDDTLSPKGQITDLSSSTIFLETFVSMKKSLELLLESVNSGDSSSTKNLAGSWEKVVNTFSDELPQNSIENIREAEIVRDAIVEGKPISASDVEVERLSDELEKLSGYVDAKLRQHQIEIVDKAISATENALPPQGNRKAGVIWQTIGSGLSLSLISYILRASFHPRLRNSHFCILVDRLILINQFLHLFDQSDYQNLLPITTPSRKEELASILASNNYQIIVSTIQKFDESISSEQTCVFVGYDLHKFPQSVFEKFKNSTFILFSSTPYQADSNIANVFGNLVSSYSMKQAIVDEKVGLHDSVMSWTPLFDEFQSLF